MSEDRITRRHFVAGATGAALSAMVVPRHVLGGPHYQPPSQTVNFALVGCGGQGMSDATELVAGGHNLVALVDVDFGYVDASLARRARGRNNQPNPQAAKIQEAYGKAKRYADFRKMLEAQKDIDAVLVATPDHTHAIIAKAAMEAGKHVYVEKPLAWSVQEARVLRETAQKTKIVTQMGNQGHSSEGAALINEWIQAGIIGPVREVHVWTNRPIWPQGISRPGKAAAAGGRGGNFGNEWTSKKLSDTLAEAMLGNAGNAAPPPNLDWDLFLGPAPDVPYHSIYHPFNWRGWVDWGTGALGDMGAHLVDHPYWALGLKYPTSIEATSTPWGMDSDFEFVSYPLAMQAVYPFPARGNQPPVKMTWYDGGLMPGRPEMLPDNIPLDRGGGVLMVGEKGVLMHGTYGADPKIFPEGLREAAQKVPKTHPRPAADNAAQGGSKHRLNWANAIKGKEKATCPFDYAGPLVETMLLGIVALRTGQGRRIRFDGETGKISSHPEYNSYLEREYRKGWSLK
jgi:predicted dehydrogenase